MRPFLFLFTNFKIIGYEHIKDLQSPLIFAPNHSNSIDSILLPLALPFWSQFSPIFYVAMKPKNYTGWRRTIFTIFNLEHIGAYAISHNKKDYADSLAKHLEILHDGGVVGIFPEGGFTKDGEIRRAHGGVSYLANAANLPVIPVLIRGTFKLPVKDILLRRKGISVEFFPPMYFEKIGYANSSEVAEEHRSNAEKILNIIRKAKGEEEVTL